ncbi:nitrate reductase cytochrome c-type subunit [Sansalvadorimonas verongulae]|uniref:nitrate reductase cytochrome c-type subunit n=1 Tax=Sansalvadorimonas verongulae TaxID=2172824 RepID=UPI0012BD5C9E|nr:nitrate reductase cytochrome c-type subunit [Sansalvadorimonas verongulae]MTI14820.1 nitrate reductase cytochrome c-type subunit [Sansalvadorimonas verongulae]
MQRSTFNGITSLSALFVLLSIGVVRADYDAMEGEPESLRGNTPLLDEKSPPRLKDFPKEIKKPLPNYVGQPPLIPHSIRGYDITANSNPCLACHSLENAPKFKATPIGVSHFRDRDGHMLPDVSPSRYNCTQCHVPQKNAPPLIENLFKPVKSLQQ